MEIAIHSKSGQICRELKELLTTLPALQCVTLQKLPEAIPEWLLTEESRLYVPSLGEETQGLELHQTGNSLQNLLEKLRQLSGIQRQGVLECALTLTGPRGFQKKVTASCEGMITTEIRGGNHFGFDAIFQKYDYEKTFAELDEVTKSKVSHRAKAFEKLRIKLESLNSAGV